MATGTIKNDHEFISIDNVETFPFTAPCDGLFHVYLEAKSISGQKGYLYAMVQNSNNGVYLLFDADGGKHSAVAPLQKGDNVTIASNNVDLVRYKFFGIQCHTIMASGTIKKDLQYRFNSTPISPQTSGSVLLSSGFFCVSNSDVKALFYKEGMNFFLVADAGTVTGKIFPSPSQSSVSIYNDDSSDVYVSTIGMD